LEANFGLEFEDTFAYLISSCWGEELDKEVLKHIELMTIPSKLLGTS